MIAILPAAALQAASQSRQAHDEAAAAEVARLDTDFQAAVKRNDADLIDRILHPDFILILGDGRTEDRETQLREARSRSVTYELQDEVPGTQKVRVFGETAVVTAKLRIKGRAGAKSFDKALWFSDVYVKHGGRWKYALGQVSLPLSSN